MLINSVEIVVKKSRFIGLLYEVHSIDDVKDILEGLSKEHKKARHMPYAYKVSGTAKKSDDKEPSGTAGSPIYNIFERKNMDNYLIVVIRYFGGIKLGAGGLIRAYGTAANEVTKNY